VPLSNSLVEVPLCHAIFRSLPTPCPPRAHMRAQPAACHSPSPTNVC
jgi:hypothetical protein